MRGTKERSDVAIPGRQAFHQHIEHLRRGPRKKKHAVGQQHRGRVDGPVVLHGEEARTLRAVAPRDEVRQHADQEMILRLAQHQPAADALVERPGIGVLNQFHGIKLHDVHLPPATKAQLHARQHTLHELTAAKEYQINLAICKELAHGK
jgi:hypothetical protein